MGCSERSQGSGGQVTVNPAALGQFLANCRENVGQVDPFLLGGRLTRINGLVMEATGLKLPLGASTHIQIPGGGTVEAEVVGFSGERLFMMPAEDVYGLAPGALVLPIELPPQAPRVGEDSAPIRRQKDRAKHLPVGNALLGRVVDGNGRPLDSLGPLKTEESRSLMSRPLNPLLREPIRHSMDVGIRAINALLTVGRGQRLGLFAGSGVGKSVLLGMMARYTQADVIVVGLIGERGREVKEFIEQNLGAEGRARSVVVAAPADVSPLMRLQGASYATAIAEHFRDQGKHVLLIMDSLTRFAMAQREIALAIGEPPVTRGYPPSVFARLPQLVDIEQSISRVMPNLIENAHLERVRQFKQLYSRYQRARDLLSVGAYAPGSDPLLDRAIALFPQLEAFLQQGIGERADYPSSLERLSQLFGAA